jgi:cytochrome c oxidase subunit 3
MEIPYTVAARPDTGLNNGKIGIWLFLASEVMLFGRAVRVVHPPANRRRRMAHGSHYLNIPMATLNTDRAHCSSVTMVMAVGVVEARRLGKFRTVHGWRRSPSGAVFLVVKYFEVLGEVSTTATIPKRTPFSRSTSR